MFSPCDLPTLHRMQDTAQRTRQMIHTRAVREYCLAFGSEPLPDSNLCMCVIGNSLIDFENGKPWREVDYSHMRNARRLTQMSHVPSQIVNAWYRRKCGIAA